MSTQDVQRVEQVCRSELCLTCRHNEESMECCSFSNQPLFRLQRLLTVTLVTHRSLSRWLMPPPSGLRLEKSQRTRHTRAWRISKLSPNMAARCFPCSSRMPLERWAACTNRCSTISAFASMNSWIITTSGAMWNPRSA